MNTWKDLAYAPEHGKYGLLDVYVPDAAGCPVVVVIHGGGLKEFSKERMDNVALFLAGAGYAVANINYRLVGHSPFPAALQDTLRVIRWIKGGNCAELSDCDLGRVSLLGSSAGGFLALACGFILGADTIKSVVDISGPALPGWYKGNKAAEGEDPRLYQAPVELVGSSSPPVLAIHSRNDRLVPPDDSLEVIKALHAAGKHGRLYLFDGPGTQHGIWHDGDQPQPHLFEHLENEIIEFLEEMG